MIIIICQNSYNNKIHIFQTFLFFFMNQTTIDYANVDHEIELDIMIQWRSVLLLSNQVMI
jgi:hypothetical protein